MGLPISKNIVAFPLYHDKALFSEFCLSHYTAALNWQMEKLRGRDLLKVIWVVVSSGTRSGTSVSGSYPSQCVTASSPWEGFHRLPQHMPKRTDSSHIKCVSAFRARLLPVTCGWPAGFPSPLRLAQHCVRLEQWMLSTSSPVQDNCADTGTLPWCKA